MEHFPNFSDIAGFDWDDANLEKNWDSHQVAPYECEEIILRGPILLHDFAHSTKESRFFALGKTVRERLLTIVFTVRNNKIRIISARDMSRKERKFYEQA